MIANVENTMRRAADAGKPLGLSPGQTHRLCLKGLSIKGEKHFPEGAERRAGGWFVSTAALRELFAKAADAARGIPARSQSPARNLAHERADAACQAIGL